ncbi:hypothetical protein F4604DRAFT_1676749 [Suillus subluteus]|nr:hypothetical protein F4604DRAFT_1676749 [Suillus subluteus]
MATILPSLSLSSSQLGQVPDRNSMRTTLQSCLECIDRHNDEMISVYREMLEICTLIMELLDSIQSEATLMDSSIRDSGTYLFDDEHQNTAIVAPDEPNAMLPLLTTFDGLPQPLTHGRFLDQEYGPLESVGVMGSQPEDTDPIICQHSQSFVSYDSELSVQPFLPQYGLVNNPLSPWRRVVKTNINPDRAGMTSESDSDSDSFLLQVCGLKFGTDQIAGFQVRAQSQPIPRCTSLDTQLSLKKLRHISIWMAIGKFRTLRSTSTGVDSQYGIDYQFLQCILPLATDLCSIKEDEPVKCESVSPDVIAYKFDSLYRACVLLPITVVGTLKAYYHLARHLQSSLLLWSQGQYLFPVDSDGNLVPGKKDNLSALALRVDWKGAKWKWRCEQLDEESEPTEAKCRVAGWNIPLRNETRPKYAGEIEGGGPG